MKKDTPQAVLLRAAKRIEKPGAFCKGALARSRKGARVVAVGRVAASWCALGSLIREARNGLVRHDAVKALAAEIGGASIAEWNDAPERTAKQVAAAMRRAAKRKTNNLEK